MSDEQVEGPAEENAPGAAAADEVIPGAARPGWFGRHRRSLIEWGSIIAIAVVAAVVLRSFVIQPYFIPSGSMETTLHIGDKVLVNKLSYDMHGIHRGDVIVFNKPANDFDPGVNVLIKRVIGLPGETVSARNGQILINGKVLAQPWLPRPVTNCGAPNASPSCTQDFGPDHVSPDCYFMMGDNRGDSTDSRIIGCIPKSLVIGRAFVIVWPLSQIGSL